MVAGFIAGAGVARMKDSAQTYYYAPKDLNYSGDRSLHYWKVSALPKGVDRNCSGGGGVASRN